VIVDRVASRTAAWYEFFPRSAEGRGDKGSTFRDCLPRVDDAKAMGFDVIYFPPIHPIGFSNRKGRNNSVTSQPGEPGVPYAIGNRHLGAPNGGGHKDVEPELGTLEDFDWLVGEIHARGMEVALDFAINCSPDHPYVADHPDWFYKRPDGTIKYAENPPKKYEDIYPLNFRCADWQTLWDEMTSIILFWAERGVRIIRVDNPHTKPVPFWEYLISKVRAQFPDAIFLSEAFTKPKMMKALGESGFPAELHRISPGATRSRSSPSIYRAYADGDARVLPRQLLAEHTRHPAGASADGGRPAFMIRAVLAATLDERLRHLQRLRALRKRAAARQEEYLDSEKYQWKDVTGSARQHQGVDHAHQPHPAGEPRAPPLRQPAFLQATTRTSSSTAR
jgi:starch synthase (maltosyl-transferring)